MKDYKGTISIIIIAGLAFWFVGVRHENEVTGIRKHYKDTLVTIKIDRALDRKLSELKNDSLIDTIQKIRLNYTLIPRTK